MGLLVYGDVAIDLIAEVDAIPAAGQDASVNAISFTPGGSAANCAAVAGCLGAPVSFIGTVGEDIWSEVIKKDLLRCNVNLDHLKQLPGQTGLTIAMLDRSKERTFCSFRGVNACGIPDEAIPKNLFVDHMILHLSGYSFQGTGSKESALALMERGKEHNMIVSLDPSYQFSQNLQKEYGNIVKELDFFFPNLEEAYQISGTKDPLEAARIIHAMGPKNVVLKLGASGCFVMSDQLQIHIPAFQNERIVDSTGAGDAFCAGFLTAHLLGFDEREAAIIGNAVAMKILLQTGGRMQPPSISEIATFLAKSQMENLANKLKSVI